MIMVTGDIHGDISRIEYIARKLDTTLDDILIILGDAGFNYYVKKDESINRYVDDGALAVHDRLANIPLTIAVVQGNHECPAWRCEGMEYEPFARGKAYRRPEAENVWYLENGGLYEFDGRDYLVLGGAHSIDRAWRQVPIDGKPIVKGRWFPDEQICRADIELAEDTMEREGKKVHGILAHTCPRHCIPTEALLEGLSPKHADYTMENLFERFSKEWNYDIWYFGHYHRDRWIDEKHRILYKTVELLK